VSSGEVRNNIIIKTEETISADGYKDSSVRMLPAGTVLLAMIGEGKTRGQTAIIRMQATINQNIAGVIIDHGSYRQNIFGSGFNFNMKLQGKLDPGLVQRH